MADAGTDGGKETDKECCGTTETESTTAPAPPPVVEKVQENKIVQERKPRRRNLKILITVLIVYYFVWSDLGREFIVLQASSTRNFLGSGCCVVYNWLSNKTVPEVHNMDVPPLSLEICEAPGSANQTSRFSQLISYGTPAPTATRSVGWCSPEDELLRPDIKKSLSLVYKILDVMLIDLESLLSRTATFVSSVILNSIYLAITTLLAFVFVFFIFCYLAKAVFRAVISPSSLSMKTPAACPLPSEKDPKATGTTKTKPCEESSMCITSLLKSLGLDVITGCDLDEGTYKQGSSTASNFTLNDYKGASEAKKELELVVDFLKDPKKYHDMGARSPRGVLLYGPPGTGKTLFARALAGEAKVTFMHKCASEFRSKFVGSGARNIRSLFASARQNAPCILFIDEIDSISKRTTSDLHPYANQAINQILYEMDGFIQNDSAVIVIGATNRLDNIDEALRRPGRFDKVVHVDLPDFDSRKEIIEHYVGRLKKVGVVDAAVIARKTDEYSGAELESLVNDAALIAVTEAAENVEQKHLEMAVEKRRKSRDKMDEFEANDYKPSRRKAIEHMYN